MKLYPFIDSLIHAFVYTKESKPSAIFHCDKNVSKWRLFWKDVVGGKAIILLHLAVDSRIHSTIGLNALEFHGINNETVVLVVEERLPKSDCSITYELIMDLSKLSLELCASLSEKGYMFLLEDRTLWTPKHIQEQRDQEDEKQCDSVPVVPAGVQTNIEPTPPKKRATKRKSAMGPSREEMVEVEGKPKRDKADEPQSLQQCVTMSASNIEKLNKAKQTEMKNLYS